MTHAPGWYPDSTGRYAQRYYDGQQWTDHVANAQGSQSVDPVVRTPVPTPQVTGAPAAPAAQAQEPWRPSSGAASPFAPPSSGGGTVRPLGALGGTPGATSGFTLTVGTIVGGVGALLALLSLFVFNFWKAGSLGVSLGDISDASEMADLNGVATSYAGFGRFLAVLAIAAVVVVMLRLPALASLGTQAPLIAAGVTGFFALWHLISLFVAPEGGGMAITGLLGALGLGAVAAAPFLTQPVGNVSK